MPDKSFAAGDVVDSTPGDTGEGYVLVTGFEPFGGDDVNPSALIAERLDGSLIGGVRVVGACLPVDAALLPSRLDELFALGRPRAVLSFGLAAGRCAVAVERVAVNVHDFRIPDNAGAMRQGEPVVPGGSDAYLSRLPVRESVARLRAECIPAYISDTAGLYLCNACMYLVLHGLSERGWVSPAGFVHVPYITEQAAQQDAPKPSLPLETLVQAATTLVEAALSTE